jgi:hypothetical protein
LTFKINSDSPHTAWWSATTVPPAAAYSSSLMKDPSPAPA